MVRPGRPAGTDPFRDVDPLMVSGTADGHPFDGAFMAPGDGRHQLPVRAAIRREIGKESGDEVTIDLRARRT